MNVIINLQSFILVNKTTFIVISPSTMPCNICCITFMYQLMLIKWWQFDVRRYTQGTDMHLGCLLGLAMMFWIDGMHLSSLVIHVIMIRNARPQLFFTSFVIETCRLRILADSKGYILDDTGLYLATPGSGGKRVCTCDFSFQIHTSCLLCSIHCEFLQGGRSDAIINCDTEKDVFDTLGFPWLEPHERNL